MKVSVVMPAYNVGRLLEEAVESVFSTDYPELEILIIEDGSKDDTLRVAEHIQKRDSSRIRLLRHNDGRNKGAAASRNVGIANAGGELVTFLDADDWYLPNRFKESVRIFEQNADVDGVYEAAEVWHEGRSSAPGQEGPSTNNEIIEVCRQKEPNLLVALQQTSWHTNAVTFRRNFFGKVGYFNESRKIVPSEDSELWARCALIGNLVRGDSREAKPVAVYRRYAGNRWYPGADVERQIAIIKLQSSVLAWSQTNSTCPSMTRTLESRLYASTYEKADRLLGEGAFLRSKGLLAILALNRSHVLGHRKFWGNVLKVKIAKRLSH